MKKWIGMWWGLLFVFFSLAHAGEALLQLGQGSGEVGTRHNIVQVSMTNDTSIIALQLAIVDVPDFIKPDSVWVTARTSSFMVDSREDSLGVFHILLFTFDKNTAIASGSGAVLNIGYTVEPGAANFSAVDLIFYTLPTVVIPGSQKIPVTTISGKFAIGNTAVGEIKDAKPMEFALQQNFPNPFNPCNAHRFSDAAA